MADNKEVAMLFDSSHWHWLPRLPGGVQAVECVAGKS